MSKPVASFKIEKKPKADFLGPIRLLIEGKPFQEWLNDLSLSATKKTWAGKDRCAIDIEALKKSATEQGNLMIALCANCFLAGYKICEDIRLAPIAVSHEGGRVSWNIELLDAAVSHTLVFDEIQYLRELEKLALIR